jgi:hypothetical protein
MFIPSSSEEQEGKSDEEESEGCFSGEEWLHLVCA